MPLFNRFSRPTMLTVLAMMGPACVMPCAAGQPTAPQPAAEPAPATPPGRPINYTLKVRGELGTSADLSGSPGEVSVSRVGANIGAGIPVGDRGLLGLGLDYELSSYTFDDATGLVAGTDTPFGDVQRYAFSARYAHQLSARWSVLVGGGIGISGEEGAKTSDSLFYNGFAGGRYALSESVQAGFGLVLATQLEDNTLVLPLLMVDWQIDEKWRLSNEGKLGLTLSYAATDAWTLGLGAGYESRDFRLDRSGPVPGGVGRERRVPIEFSATYTPTKQLSIDLGLGVGVARNFEVLSSGGTKVADFDADAAPFVSLQLGYRF